MNRSSLVVVAIAILFFHTDAARSADVRLERDRGKVSVRLEGEIIPGDADRMARTLAQARVNAFSIVVTLSGPGGSYLEGIRLARLFLENGVGTLVRRGT